MNRTDYFLIGVSLGLAFGAIAIIVLGALSAAQRPATVSSYQ